MVAAPQVTSMLRTESVIMRDNNNGHGANGDSTLYQKLLRAQAVRGFQADFCSATGWAMHLFPSRLSSNGENLSDGSNALINWFVQIPFGREAYQETVLAELDRLFVADLGPHRVTCFAGLTHIGLPVKASGRHVATWVGGQVFTRKPTKRGCAEFIKRLRRHGVSFSEPSLRVAYFETPVMSPQKFQATASLLMMCAQVTSEIAQGILLDFQGDEPPAVRWAKQHVRGHLHEHLSMSQVARIARTSPDHFCKLFKQSTGITFTDYVTRLRVEEAKRLLLDRQTRISEIAFSVGFNAIPYFNRVMRQHTGMSPSEYRDVQLRRARELSSSSETPSHSCQAQAGCNPG